MRREEEIEGILAILEKDLKAYYFKPPNISWGILFPVVLALSFSLRNPNGLIDLSPGLIAMAALFGTTSMEAIVITFEKRVGALERLQLAPINASSRAHKVFFINMDSILFDSLCQNLDHPFQD